jgi:oligosaccharide repeat unit polymerase
MAGSYFSLLRSKREFLPPAISFARPQILSGLSLVLALFWTIYYMRWAFSQGNISTVLLGSRTQQALIGVIKTDGYGVDAIYGVSGILLLYIAQHRIIQDHKTDVKLRILVSAYLLTLIPSLLNGDRSKFIFFVLVLVMVYVNTGMKIGRNRIIAIVLILPIVITAPRVYRSSVEGIKAKSFNNLISVKTISDTFTQEDLAMAPTFSILVNSFEKNEDYLHGNSYLALISKPLPRKLWPNKPIPFDVEMTRKIFPIESKYVGFSFSGLSEPYANFGYFGVVVFFFIIGFLNRRLLNRARNMNISSVLLNSWTAGFMFILARGNLTTDMQRFAFPLISGLILISRKKNLIND